MSMLDYDREADSYDLTRGGEERAGAAAAAIEWLLRPTWADAVLDVACGTGIVTARLRHPARTVVGIDRSPGMLARAAPRLRGRALLGDAAALPVASGRADAVLMIWLLHLLPDAEPVIAEAARVLGPAGVLVTTVDKNEAAFAAPSDVAEITAGPRQAYADRRADGHDRVVALAARHGLRKAAETTFAGPGQGRSPLQWRERIRAGAIPWAATDRDPAGAELALALAELPDQDECRPDPVYRIIALTR